MNPLVKLPRPARAAVALAPAILLWPDVRNFADARMSVLMMIEFPWLVAAGFCASTFLSAAAKSAIARLNAMSLVSYTLTLLVFSYWMIPSALDEALTSTMAYLARHFTWFIAGFFLGTPGRDTTAGVDIFFVGNLAWMTASAGLLYRETEMRLCVNYLLADQLVAGGGLIAIAAALLVAITWAARSPPSES